MAVALCRVLPAFAAAAIFAHLAVTPSFGEPARGGKAIRFDKDTPELSVASSPVMEANELTIELWARLDGPQAEHAQFVRKLASWDKPGFLLAASQSGYGCVQFRWWDESLQTLPDSILATWYFDQWHHFAAVYAPGKVVLYVDGIEVSRHESKVSRPLVHDRSAPIRIGPEGFTGQLDEVRIWGKALPAAAIKGQMYRTLRGTEDNLIAYWPFEDASDRSPNHLSFDGDPDLSARLVDSGAPLDDAARKTEHQRGMVKIRQGREEVEGVARRLPPLNAAIYRFATSLANESFGSGDCWNFVNRAMSIAGARGRDVYIFGDSVPIKDALPGDLVQFEKFSSPGFGSERHSAILWRNHGNGRITVIHQNAPPNGKQVGLLDVDVERGSGSVLFYRPTP